MMRHPFFAVALIAATTFAHAEDRLEGIALEWKPKISFGALGSVHAADVAGVKIQLVPLKDVRSDPRLIAENREKNVPRPVTTRDDVAAFVTARLKKTLTAAGFDIVDSGGDLMLAGEVQKYFVAETDHYYANVALGVSVFTGRGKTLWSGVVAGSSKQFGRSYKAENYFESLSDALLRAIHKLAEDPGFRAALKKH